MKTLEDNPIRAARKAHGWSQAELARRAGLSLPTIIDHEHGRKLPLSRTRHALVVVLGVPAATLWPDDEEKTR